MHPIDACILRPVKVAVGVLLVALFGFISLLSMPMQLTPEVQIPTLTIETRWPGASPQEVEREIIQEQEEQLKSVEGLVKMSSESKDSIGLITLEFAVGSNIDQLVLRVNSRLQQVQEYPIDARQPVISTSDSNGSPIAWFILSPKLVQPADVEAFQQRHPQLASLVEPARTAHNPGLAVLRIRRLVETHPEQAELRELLPPDVDINTYRKFAEDVIEARFERVEGVANSNVLGGRDPELQVIVDPQRLAARQITLLDVRNALREQNKDTSGGDFWEDKRRWVVRTLGQYPDPEAVAAQVITIRDGRPVLVRDVAEVVLTNKKPDGFVRRFGSDSIAVNCLRETGANVLEIMRDLKEATHELNERQLRHRGLELVQVYDETEYIYSAVGLVNTNIVVGGLLTIIVLLLYLRSARSTLVIALAIPTSLVGTFLVLHVLGRSLNVISLAGLAFAVGMLVDNAVVVLENIYRRYQLGEAPFVAAARGAKEVWGAIVASTLTTLAVFIPVVFVQEEAGQLFRDIALAISAAVGLSLLVSVTVIPPATARLFGRRQPGKSGRANAAAGATGANGDTAKGNAANGNAANGNAANGNAGHGRLRRIDTGAEPQEVEVLAESPWLHWLAPIDRVAGRVLRGIVTLNDWIQLSTLRQLAVVGTLVLVAAGLSWVLWPKVEYLPNGNRNLVFGIVLPPPGYNLDKLAELGQIVEDELKPHWDVDPGSPEAAAVNNLVIEDFFFVARDRRVFVGVRSVNPLRARELVPVVMRINAKLPGTFIFAQQSSLFGRGLTAGRTIDIEVTGPDVRRLVEIGGGIMGQVSQVVGGQAQPIPSLDLSSPEVHVIPRRVPAAEMGFSNTDVGFTVNALIDGAYVTDYYDGGEKIDLVLVGASRFVQRTQDLQTLPIATPSGQLVPLSALAEVNISSGPEQINRRERQRAITIQVSPPPEMPLERALELINTQIVQPRIAAGEIGDDYRIALSGTSDKLRDTWGALRFNLLLALLITYLLMAALFESWWYPLVVILSVPLGAVGGVLGLNLLNAYLALQGEPPQALDVLTMLGFVILIGTVVNNPILIVHQALNNMRDERMPQRRAILESVRTRVRPIFMTTTTTVFGLLPLVLFPGNGSELYRGLGSVVLGGLVMSTAFTLVLVPALFGLMMDLRTWLFGASEEGHSAEAKLAELLDQPEHSTVNI